MAATATINNLAADWKNNAVGFVFVQFEKKTLIFAIALRLQRVQEGKFLGTERAG